MGSAAVSGLAHPRAGQRNFERCHISAARQGYVDVGQDSLRDCVSQGSAGGDADGVHWNSRPALPLSGSGCDYYIQQGTYPRTTYPVIIGSDGSGIVERRHEGQAIVSLPPGAEVIT